MYSDLICDECGFVMVYDAKTDWYIKCPCCDKVLIDVDLSTVDIEEFVVVDHGTAYGSKWIKVKDSKGHQDIYWKNG